MTDEQYKILAEKIYQLERQLAYLQTRVFRLETPNSCLMKETSCLLTSN